MALIRLGVLWPELGQGCASDEAIIGDRLERCFEGKSALRMRVEGGHSPLPHCSRTQGDNWDLECFV